jgi:hypothetical protein
MELGDELAGLPPPPDLPLLCPLISAFPTLVQELRLVKHHLEHPFVLLALHSPRASHALTHSCTRTLTRADSLNHTLMSAPPLLSAAGSCRDGGARLLVVTN